MQRFILFLLLNIFITTCCATTTTNFADQPDVQAFIQMMVKKHKFKKQTLVTLFTAVKERPQVIKSLNKPLEKESWHTYQMLFVNGWRIQQGVKFWKQYEATLKRAEKTYGVPASIIVATIGIETKYGSRTGDYRVMAKN
jgi:membrane-bound lytic murein transglycosylase B